MTGSTQIQAGYLCWELMRGVPTAVADNTAGAVEKIINRRSRRIGVNGHSVRLLLLYQWYSCV
jgi:hypothetical protein